MTVPRLPYTVYIQYLSTTELTYFIYISGVEICFNFYTCITSHMEN